MDLGYALLLLGSSHDSCAHALRMEGPGERSEPTEPEAPASSERERREPESPSEPAPTTLPGLGDPRAPDANPIDPRVT